MGWRAAELIRLALPPETATILEDHQLTPELVNLMKGVPLVIFLDAAVDLSPGTIRFQALRPAEVQPWSHHLLPAQLLKFAEGVNGKAPAAFLISGGVEEIGLSETMTPTGQECASRMADLARRLVQHVSDRAGLEPLAITAESNSKFVRHPQLIGVRSGKGEFPANGDRG